MPLPSLRRSHSCPGRAPGLSLAVAAAALLLGACQRTEPSAAPPPAAGLSFAALAERAHFAFRAEGAGAYALEHDTYRAEVAPTGRLRFTPRLHGAAAPLTLETRALGRGEARALPPAAPQLRADGSLALARGEAVEVLQSGPHGVEQRWEFARAPAGEGDLLVRVAVGEARLRARTHGGLHYAAAEQGPGARYGLATWVDAAGRRTSLRPEAVGQDIVLRVPHALVEGSGYPAVLDPVLGPEAGIDVEVVGPASRRQLNPAAAAADASGVVLLVWTDQRRGMERFSTDIYGARIDTRSGTDVLMDPAGFPIATTAEAAELPAVASDGSDFLVAWEQSQGTGQRIFAARVAADGSVAPRNGRPVSTRAALQFRPQVAWGGGSYLVVWTDDRTGSNGVYAHRVDPAGQPREEADLAVSEGAPAGNAQGPGVSFGTTDFLVGWQQHGASQVLARHVSAAGAVVGSAPELVAAMASSGQEVRSTFGAGTFLLTFGGRLTSAAGDSNAVHGVRFDAGSGLPLDTVPVRLSGTSNNPLSHTAAFNAERFVVAWEVSVTGGTDLVGTALLPTGAPDAPRSLLGAAAASPRSGPLLSARAQRPRSLLLSYAEVQGSDYDVLARDVDANLNSALAQQVSRAANSQELPAVAWDGAQYLAAWRELRGSERGSSLYAARLGPDRQVLDGAGVLLAQTDAAKTAPRVAASPQGFLVAWAELPSGASGSSVRAVRVSPAGAVLDAPPLTLTTDGDFTLVTPDVDFDGTQYLVAWTNAYKGGLRAARIPASGGAPGSALPLLDGSGLKEGPRVAFGGGQHLLVWEDRPSFSEANLLALRLSPEGTVLDASPQTLVGASGDQRLRGLVWDGARFVLAWEDDRDPATAPDVYAGLVTASASASNLVLQTVPLAREPGAQQGVALAFDGVSRLVAWGAPQPDGAGTDLVGQWLDAQGTPLLAAPALLAGGPTLESAPALAGNGAGRALLAFDRFDESHTVGSQRVRLRLAESPRTRGAACASDAECGSGFCTDGVCCESRCGGAAQDCQACSAAAGASADGTCTLLPATTVCRAAGPTCDVAEQCTGTAPGCPADAKAPDATACEAGTCSAGLCVAEPVSNDAQVRSHYDWNCAAGGGSTQAGLWGALLLLGLLRRRAARVRGAGAALALLLALAAPRAYAQEAAAAAAPRPRLAFLGVEAGAGVSAAEAQAVSEYLQSQLAGLQLYQVTGPGEIRALLGLERQRELLGCSEGSSSCLAELAGALDAERAIVGSLSRLGSTTLINLSLVDSRTTELLARVGRRVPGTQSVEPVLSSIPELVDELTQGDPRVRALRPQRASASRWLLALRGEGDMVGSALAPSVMGQLRSGPLAAALTVVAAPTPGLRLEGRYLFRESGVQPYVGVGGTAFGAALGARGSAGVQLELGRLVLLGDVAYEHFFTGDDAFEQQAVLVGAGVGWGF